MTGEIHLLPPVPGACPICGAKHGKDEPHDEDSAYYAMRKRRSQRRERPAQESAEEEE